METAFQLPGPLQWAGDWKVNAFLAQLERNRDFSRARVFGLRISYQPTTLLEFGDALDPVRRSRRDQSFRRRSSIPSIRPIREPTRTSTKAGGMADFRLRLPLGAPT